MEEAAYIKPECFFQVVAPILSPSNVCWICITTIASDPTNYFTILKDSKLFSTLEISMVCDACKCLGVSERCRHKPDSTPHWSNEGRLQVIENAFGAVRKDDFLRESMGHFKQKDDACFDKELVYGIFNVPRLPLKDVVHFIYVAVDPASGSNSMEKQASDYAIVSTCQPGTTILGIDAISATRGGEMVDRMFVEHLRRLRSFPATQNAVLVVGVESGTGLEANRLYRLANENFRRIILMNEFAHKEGLKMVNDVKKDMMERTRADLNAGAITVSGDLFSVTNDVEAHLDELKNQLLRFKSVTKGDDTNPFKHPKTTYTGKGASGREKDDLAVTLQWNVQMKKNFWYSGKYNRYHAGGGL